MVWTVFVVAASMLVVVLAMSEGRPRAGFLVATNVSPMASSERPDPIFDLRAELDLDRWTGIVIHHLGRPAGDAESVRRQHQAWGYASMGYHFVIGNGNGLGDGVIQVGERWTHQQPGVHVLDAAGEHHNERSIGICLIGNGDRRPFTAAQIESLVRLVRALQDEIGVPADRVYRHSDLVAGVSSPGTWFPIAAFRDRLRR